jgi:hypothetical protein
VDPVRHDTRPGTARRPVLAAAVLAGLVATVAACGSSSTRGAVPSTIGRPATAPPTTRRAAATSTTRPRPTTTTHAAPVTTTTVPATPPATPPPTGAPVPVPAPGPPAATATPGVNGVTAAQLGRSWHPGCPVGPDQLRLLTLPYWGFDGVAHTGHLVVNAASVDAVRSVFTRLAAAHFPIRKMLTIDHYGASDDASVADDNTAAFNCRLAVNPGGPASWSEHAYGDAIDVNPVENPYVESNGVVDPPAGSAWLDRSNHRPGMAFAGSPLNDAFGAVGWGWGGTWGGNPDYQHFSVNGQ